ncbi:MAG: hypothetical protein U0794_01750 [Isosphaeraceae bacterium]
MSIPRVQITLWRMMALVALLAFGLAAPRATTLGVILTLAVFAVRRLLTRPRADRAWAVAYLVALACLYLPFARTLGVVTWEPQRLRWIGYWPVLPGMVATEFLLPIEWVRIAEEAATSLLMLAAFTALGARGRAYLVVANGVLLLAAAYGSSLGDYLFWF